MSVKMVPSISRGSRNHSPTTAAAILMAVYCLCPSQVPDEPLEYAHLLHISFQIDSNALSESTQMNLNY